MCCFSNFICTNVIMKHIIHDYSVNNYKIVFVKISINKSSHGKFILSELYMININVLNYFYRLRLSADPLEEGWVNWKSSLRLWSWNHLVIWSPSPAGVFATKQILFGS
jgi:hypothetical protein